jgi:hypothetical protein
MTIWTGFFFPPNFVILKIWWIFPKISKISWIYIRTNKIPIDSLSPLFLDAYLVMCCMGTFQCWADIRISNPDIISNISLNPFGYQKCDSLTFRSQKYELWSMWREKKVDS